jgi:soluble lytic murein transglycosylase-like protein
MKCVLIIGVLLIAARQSRAGCADAYRCVQHYAAHYRVSPDFIAALIDVESGWNPHAVSNKGAIDAGDSSPVWRL